MTKARVHTIDGGNQWSITTDAERFARFHDGSARENSVTVRYTQDIHHRVWEVLEKRTVTRSYGSPGFATEGHVFLTEEDLDFLRSLKG